ncbi:MAG: type II toxin-antitoxin system VapC family toxin [Desulfofustis sp. PB-SRB1]|nr:type II toxin-antitoxin system VapC family toxin [Desulfofustis sp. PB-SRB1]
MIVVDTDIICSFYLNSEHSAFAEQIFQKDSNWAAPLLWKSEFRNVLALYLRKGIIELSGALEIIGLAEELLNKNVYEVNSFQVLKLTNFSGCSAYDCEFVSLAKDLDTILVTEDKKVLKNSQKQLIAWLNS